MTEEQRGDFGAIRLGALKARTAGEAPAVFNDGGRFNNPNVVVIRKDADWENPR